MAELGNKRGARNAVHWYTTVYASRMGFQADRSCCVMVRCLYSTSVSVEVFSELALCQESERFFEGKLPASSAP